MSIRKTLTAAAAALTLASPALTQEPLSAER
ncbi:MAG: hypothetical protein RL299_2175, partial [Pseudomonadota bacterium]